MKLSAYFAFEKIKTTKKNDNEKNIIFVQQFCNDIFLNNKNKYPNESHEIYIYMCVKL